jgi:hypothetical protein
MFKITSKKIAAVGLGTSIAIASSVAFAAWTADGSGNGAAKAETKSGLVVTAGAPASSGDLYPGAEGDVVFTLKNNNAYAVKVASVYHLPADKISSGDGTCDADGAARGLSYRGGWDDSAPAAVDKIIAAGDTLTLTVDNGIAMDNNTVDACSGKTFTVPVAVHAASDTSDGATVTTASVLIP